MYSSEGDLYIASWNTQEAGAGNGNHQIEFRAIDLSDNVITENIVQQAPQIQTQELPQRISSTNESSPADEGIPEVSGHEIKSPMVGVAYLSADPNSSPYVKIGQHVKAGETLLLIEAMKTFNEIKAPRSGIIKKIVTLNSQPVEYGDTLIIFE